MSLSPFLKLLVAVQLHPSGREGSTCQKTRGKCTCRDIAQNPPPARGASSLPLLYLGRLEADSSVCRAKACPPPVKLKQSMIFSYINNTTPQKPATVAHRSSLPLPKSAPVRISRFAPTRIEKTKPKEHKLVGTTSSCTNPPTLDAGPPSSSAPLASSVALRHAACRSASEKTQTNHVERVTWMLTDRLARPKVCLLFAYAF